MKTVPEIHYQNALARCMCDDEPGPSCEKHPCASHVTEVIGEAISEEREACAQLCDAFAASIEMTAVGTETIAIYYASAARGLASAIRARGET